MTAARLKADWPILAVAVAVLVLVPLSLYVGGYFALGSTVPPLPGAQLLRVYPTEWQATIFKPAARIESWCRGTLVSTATAGQRGGFI